MNSEKINRGGGTKVYDIFSWFSLDENSKKNFFFKKFLPKNYTYKYSTQNPDIAFISCFSDRKSLEKINSKIKIFFTGEDVNKNYTAYKDHLLSQTNLSIGFNHKNSFGDPNIKNYIRYPLWLLYYFGNLETLEEIEKAVENFNNHHFEKTKFCALIARHDNESGTGPVSFFKKKFSRLIFKFNKNYCNHGIRTKIFKLINKIEKVSCAGKLLHNDDSLKTEFNDDKIEYLKQFVFNICPENVNVSGYVTEKLFQSFDAGCIPIYFGSEKNIEPKVINQNAIIYFDKKNKKEVFEKVKKLYTDKNAYEEFLKNRPLLPTAAKWIYEKNLELKQMFEKAFEESESTK